MAVRIECINILVRFDRLARVYPGGEAALWDAERVPNCWHDGQIVRFGSMNDLSAEMIISWLKEMGLKSGLDFGGFDLPWLEMSPEDAPSGVGRRGKPTGVLIGADNFTDFLEGKVKTKRLRATAVVQQEGLILLVRDKGKAIFSLPGGGVKEREPSIAAAIRELYEELGLQTKHATRSSHADYDGLKSRHLVSQITIPEGSKILLDKRELVEYLWWDGLPGPRIYPHVTEIINSINTQF